MSTNMVSLMAEISAQDKMRLAVETKLSLGTVTRWARGKPTTPANDYLLTKTASELGIDLKNSEVPA